RRARRRGDQAAARPGRSELGPRLDAASPGAAGPLSDPGPPSGARTRRELAVSGELRLLVRLRGSVPRDTRAGRRVRPRTRPRTLAVVERAGGAGPLLGVTCLRFPSHASAMCRRVIAVL